MGSKRPHREEATQTPTEPQPASKRHASDAEVKSALEAKLQEVRFARLNEWLLPWTDLPKFEPTRARALQAEKLRKQIEEKNRRLAEQKAAVEAQDAQARAAAEAVAQKEKSRKLAAGFSAVRVCASDAASVPQSLSRLAALATLQAVQRVSNDRSTQQGRTAGGASAGPEAARRAGDEAEVTRVLGSLTDADVLGLPPRPGADAVKQAYRSLAKKLHPDKCTAPRAKDAFQRVLKAYQRLNADSAAAAAVMGR